MQVRFGAVGWKFFHKVQDGDSDPQIPGENLLAKFVERLGNLRHMVIGFVGPRIERIFVLRFTDMYPDFTFAGGRKVTSIESFIAAIITADYGNSMRAMVHSTQNNLWGNNTWAVKLEAKVMQVIGLEYTGTYLVKTPKKNHDGNSVKDAIVKCKNTLIVQKIKRAVLKYHKEVLYKRNVGISNLVLELVPATLDSHGFNGWVGQCAGHPKLVERLSKEPPKKNPETKVDMYHWFHSLLATGVTSPEMLLEEAAKLSSLPVKVTVSEKENCVSPISGANSVPDEIFRTVSVAVQSKCLF